MTDTMKALAVQFQMMKKVEGMKVYFVDQKKPTLWHVSFKGATGSEFEGGVYHFELDLAQYPKCGPVTMSLNPNGSYEPNVAICLVGITHYHTEAWSPGTSIEAVINALNCYMIGEDR